MRPSISNSTDLKDPGYRSTLNPTGIVADKKPLVSLFCPRISSPEAYSSSATDLHAAKHPIQLKRQTKKSRLRVSLSVNMLGHSGSFFAKCSGLASSPYLCGCDWNQA